MPLDIQSFNNIRMSLDGAGVGTVAWERSARFNALDSELIEDTIRAFDILGNENDCRAVVLKGSGSSFCAGMDLENGLSSGLSNDPVLETERGVRRAFEIVKVIRAIPQPVIVPVQGHAVGAGFAIAAAADLRVAAPDAQFNPVFVHMGVSAGDLGLTWTLPRIIGHGRAVEMLLRGRIITANEALTCGLVSSIEEDPQRAAAAIAREIAALPRYGVAATKQLLSASLDTAGLTHHLESELRAQTLALLTDSHRAAVEAFRGRRKAARTTTSGTETPA